MCLKAHCGAHSEFISLFGEVRFLRYLFKTLKCARVPGKGLAIRELGFFFTSEVNGVE